MTSNWSVRRLAAVAAVVLVGATPAMAKDCKPDKLTMAGDAFLSKTLGAYPSSLLAWRGAVKDKFGDGWQNWSQAEDGLIDCAKNSNGRWVCTRTARPCKGGPTLALPVKPNVTQGINNKLVRGDSGEEVKTLQELLRRQGYDVKVDGKFGAGTEKAVRDFQRAHKLDVDGRVGPKTLEKLVA
jgi:hypothetical protein